MMSERWYTQRAGIVRGPYPAGQIRRYILLGRIQKSDQLREEHADWKPVDEFPELIPDVMTLAPTPENLQSLALAKMHEDERKPGDRRDRSPAPPAHILERRSGHERRQFEPDMVLRHRKNKNRLNLNVATMPVSLVGFAGLVVTIIGMLFFAKIQSVDSTETSPDCNASATAGVNWDNCNLASSQLSGANLQYALIRNARMDGSDLSGAWLANSRLDYTNFNASDLKQSNLSHAVIIGASLNGTDLRHANLQGANLSYANLAGAMINGANFGGAVLEQAIWVDRRVCAAGSIGECL